MNCCINQVIPISRNIYDSYQCFSYLWNYLNGKVQRSMRDRTDCVKGEYWILRLSLYYLFPNQWSSPSHNYYYVSSYETTHCSFAPNWKLVLGCSGYDTSLLEPGLASPHAIKFVIVVSARVRLANSTKCILRSLFG